jgi:surface polysaccharide O-acyltransferase-like enzyme
MRVHKYPPSLLYLCVTTGIGLLLLVLFARLRENKVLMLFGRNPLLFYVIHIALIHFLGNLYFEIRYGGEPDFSNGQPALPGGYEPSLAVVYGAWVAMVALMYGLLLLWQRARKKTSTISGEPIAQ